MTLSRRGFVRILSFLFAAVFFLLASLLLASAENTKLRRTLSAGYRRSYFELLSSVEAIESSLVKASAVSSPGSVALLAGDIYTSAEAAEARLCELPYAFSEDSHTAAFLNRVGSFARSLVSDAGRGELPDAATLLSLREAAGNVLTSLSSVSAYIYEDDFFSDEVIPNGLAEEAYSLSSGMTDLENAFPETPTLLYDGPYSEHLVGLSPKINLEKSVSEKDAAAYAADCFGVSASSLAFGGEVGGDIPCYLFTLRNGRSLTLLVTRHGGKLLGLQASGAVGEAVMNAESALDAAIAFLSACGYNSLSPSYHHTVGSVMYINFEAAENGVLFYPDLIQIGVSLADGEILSFDARGYLSNHACRELPSPAFGENELADAVNKSLTISGSQLVVIPTEGKNEIFCREFACRNQSGDRFLVYIGCQTGKEEKIMLLREDESGILAF